MVEFIDVKNDELMRVDGGSDLGRATQLTFGSVLVGGGVSLALTAAAISSAALGPALGAVAFGYVIIEKGVK